MTSLNDKKLLRNGNSFTLSTSYTQCGIPFTSSFVPVTSIYIPNYNVNRLETPSTYCSKTITPLNASFSTWFTYTSSNTSVVSVNSEGKMTFNGNGTATITATHCINHSTCSFTVEVGDTYSFGILVATGQTYPDECEMSTHNVYFTPFADNIKNGLIDVADCLLDKRRSECNADYLKNKIAPGSSHSCFNADDVDLTIYVGHGYAKNRSTVEGTFAHNCLHFGIDSSGNPHAEDNGTGAAFNYTTEDAVYFGLQAKSKWLITYTCNFLNTDEGDESLTRLMQYGGRLILGFGTAYYVDSREATAFATGLAGGNTIANAFFGDAREIRSPGIVNYDQIYRVYYKGADGGGTLNDSLFEPLSISSNLTLRHTERVKHIFDINI